MAIRLLGACEVTGPQGTAGLVGARQRVLLALLALGTGKVLTQSRLIDTLSGDDPPRTAVRTLQSHIARVRQALDACGLPDVLVTRGSGYALNLDRESVDAHRFESLVRQARTEPPEDEQTPRRLCFRCGFAVAGAECDLCCGRGDM